MPACNCEVLCQQRRGTGLIGHPWQTCVHNPEFQNKTCSERYLTYEQACEQGLFDRVIEEEQGEGK